MKKLNNIKWFTLGVSVCILISFLTSTALASVRRQQATLVYNNIRVTLDGTEVIPKDGAGNPVEPFTVDGTTYLPLRGVAGILGLGVGWEPTTSTVMLTSEGNQQSGSAPVETTKFIHEDEYVVISFSGCELDSRNRQCMVFTVVNKTDVTLTFQADSLSIDRVSLGYISGSDDVAPNSTGKIRFRTAESFPTMSPTSISGTISVIDFSKTIFENNKMFYDVTFTNLSVK